MLSEHFTWDEAACKDGTPVLGNKFLEENAKEHVEQLEILRSALGGIPIHINSWYRTVLYNNKIGGSPDSQHLSARATDIWVTGISSETLFVVIETLIRVGILKQGGLGLYNNFVHYDTFFNGKIRRWDLRK